MVQRKLWVTTLAEELYWAIYHSVEPEVRRLFCFAIHEGYAYVFCEGHAPSAILELVDEAFFRRYNLRPEAWEPVFRYPWGGEQWIPYDSLRHGHFPNGLFGWRYRESVIIGESHPAVASAETE